MRLSFRVCFLFALLLPSACSLWVDGDPFRFAPDAAGNADAALRDLGVDAADGGRTDGAQPDTGADEDGGIDEDGGPGDDASEDAATGPDSGEEVDGGPVDGGDAPDGEPRDSGEGVDSGVLPDAAEGPDADGLDSGETPDAGGLDSGTPFDSGVGPVISGIQPAAVREGEGDASNTRAIPISIVGSGFLPGVVVQSGNALVEIVQSAVNATGDRIGVALRVRVDPTLLFGATRQVRLDVVQADGTSFVMLPVTGLNELTAPATLNVAMIEPLYSQIQIPIGGTVLTGNAPARLVATADIVVNGPLTANAGSGNNPAPGGCAGGAGGSRGGCLGGSAGADNGLGQPSGGGGGSNRTAGQVASGNSPGGPGSVRIGALVPLTGFGGQGGGGGGDGLFQSGHVGGAGGGVIELTSFGNVSVNGDVSATGGPGLAPTGGGIVCSDVGAAGGGGAGGAVLVRGGGAVAGAGNVLLAGGPAGNTPCAGDGGDGGNGWLRVDTPVRPLPAGLTPHVFGPMLLAATPVIVRSQMVTLSFAGAPSTAYTLSMDGGAPQPVTTNPGGTGTTMVGPLAEGIHTACLIIAGSTEPEGRNCLSWVIIY